MKSHAFLRKITFSAMLVALYIVLSRILGAQSTYFQAGIDCVVIATACALFGPIWGSAVAVTGDFLGVLIAGIGAYFPPFAISEIWGALIFTFFLYKKDFSPLRGSLSIVCNTILNEIALRPVLIFWYYMGSQNAKSYLGILLPKVWSSLVMIPVQIAVMIPLCILVFPKLKKIMKI